jgi:hypothetical protein
MSLFIFSLLAGFLLYQALSLIQPIPGLGDYRIGRRIVVHLPEETYLAWRAAIIAVSIAAFILVATIIIAQPFHPAQGYAYRFVDALTSPRMAAAVFGGFVGLLVANLLNRILRSPPEYTFKPADYLEIILILVLVVLGIGGEGVLQSYARRINKISLGTTTEISFSESRPRSSRTAAEQPNTVFRSTANNDPFGGPVGLRRLADLRDNIARTEQMRPSFRTDEEFFTALAIYESPSNSNSANIPVDFIALAEKVLTPIGRCLLDISTRRGDGAIIDKVLAPLGDGLRDVALATSPMRPEMQTRAATHIQTSVGELRGYGMTTTDCRTAAAIGPADYDGGTIEKFRSSGNLAPYAALAYASVMAARHHYQAAIITMDNWISRHSDGTTVQQRWYVLRARFGQGFFVEEWLRDRGLAAPTSLREYHIDNLSAIVRGMEAFNIIAEISRKNRDYTWSAGLLGISQSGDGGMCDIPDVPRSPASPQGGRLTTDQQMTLRKLYESYLSARKDYVDHALKHPTMKNRSADIIATEIKNLMAINLRCIETNTRPLTRAEHIERYVRTEMNLLENGAFLKSGSEIRDRVSASQQLLAFAFQLIEPDVAAAKADKVHAKSHATSDDDAPTLPIQLGSDYRLETFETLLTTQEQLQNLSERELVQ